MQALGQEGVEVPGQMLVERELRLRASDRVELVLFVAQPLRAIGRQLVDRRIARHLARALAREAVGAVVAGHRAAADRAGGVLEQLERRILVELVADRLLQRHRAHLQDVVRGDLLGGDLDLEGLLQLLVELDRHRASSIGAARSGLPRGCRSGRSRRVDPSNGDRTRPDPKHAVCGRILHHPVPVLAHRVAEEPAEPDPIHVVVGNDDGTAGAILPRPRLDGIEHWQAACRHVRPALSPGAAGCVRVRDPRGAHLRITCLALLRCESVPGAVVDLEQPGVGLDARRLDLERRCDRGDRLATAARRTRHEPEVVVRQPGQLGAQRHAEVARELEARRGERRIARAAEISARRAGLGGAVTGEDERSQDAESNAV